MSEPGNEVFLNVPFDRQYRKLFLALVFAVHECGLVARCALEKDDGTQVRLETLYEIIEDCEFGIHDLSRTTLDGVNRLPRFNMPLELGIFLGAKRYGGVRQRRKSALIVEKDPYRYQQFVSDISGQNIRAHHNTVDDALTAVRNWVRTEHPTRKGVPGPTQIKYRYVQFRRDLPAMCRDRGLDIKDLMFLDYRMLVIGWRDENPL
jgi:hypothetical protein